MYANILGGNIKALRKFYGETQEQLGEILGMEKNTISSYECGRTEPDKETLERLARHYGVFTDILLSYDLTGLPRIDLEDVFQWSENFYCYFPILTSKKAMANEHFEVALKLHKEVFYTFQKVQIEKCLNSIVSCCHEYRESLEDEDSKLCASANLLGFYHMIIGSIEICIELMEEKTALGASIISYLNYNWDEFNRSLREAYDVVSKIHGSFSERTRFIEELIINLRSTREWHELGDYYFGLHFMMGFAADSLDCITNLFTGLSIISTFERLGNPYCREFNKI
ncbi:MAG: helix-turn-helix transcriptional regulator [Lachnospiraceae bacterium]|nr:helix-turn-helix transcriptional regulator [Lachnospiraceae bacterium]